MELKDEADGKRRGLNPAFADPKNRDRLFPVLESWVGTPWRHRTVVKGLGCDCIHFVAGVLSEFGLFNLRKLKGLDYPADWHLHNTRELLLEGLKEHFNVLFLGIDQIEDGDLLLSHYGKAASHASIFCNGFIYHSIRTTGGGGGVTKSSFADSTWRKRMKYAARVYK